MTGASSWSGSNFPLAIALDPERALPRQDHLRSPPPLFPPKSKRARPPTPGSNPTVAAFRGRAPAHGHGTLAPGRSPARHASFTCPPLPRRHTQYVVMAGLARLAPDEPQPPER